MVEVAWIDADLEESLSEPRTLAHGGEVPSVGRRGAVPLVRTHLVDERVLLGAGCGLSSGTWWARATPDLPFEVLERVLPRYASRSLVPEVVDLIPSTSWHASLANLLSRKSWDLLRTEAAEAAGGCEECGAAGRIECHERWSYDERTGVQSLVRLRPLCPSCHETCHLGFARIRGRFDAAFGRLCAINRIRPEERRRYQAEIEGRFLRRSRRTWALDLARLSGRGMSLRREVVDLGGGVVSGPTRAGGRVDVMLLGVEVDSGGRGVVLS